MFLSESTTS